MTTNDIDRDDKEEMLREQIHAQQCEINVLRKELMYIRQPPALTDEEIVNIYYANLNNNDGDCVSFARELFKKAQEK